MKTSAAVFAVCVLMFLAGAAQACTLNEMSPCLSAVTSGARPSKPCCDKVAAVDVVCFCDLVKNSNYRKDYVDNAVKVPENCGGAAYAHFQGYNCSGHVIT